MSAVTEILLDADKLRRATAVLREKANAATPGPWAFHAHSGGDPICVFDEPTGNMCFLADEHGEKPHENADWIALMHPGIGLMLADWLDDERAHGGRNPHALALADLILAGEPE